MDKNNKEIEFLYKENEQLREALADSHHHGHALWCNAIKGPDGENWYEEDKCSCRLRQFFLKEVSDGR